MKILFARILRINVGPRWYAVVLLLPFAVCAVAAAITILLGAPIPRVSQLNGIGDLIPRFLFIFVFIGLGEEPGWRGFALPHLQEKYSPLKSSLILAPLWALWHAPLIGNEFAWNIVPAFLIAIVPATIFGTWIFNRAKQSVFLQMIFHATVNTVGAGWIFSLFAGTSLTLLWYVYAGVWVAVAITVCSDRAFVARTRPQVAPA